jgi:hypothetical protein
MRNTSLFAAASLGCFIVAAMSLASPQALAVSSWPPFERATCARLLDSYHDSGVKPAYGTPEYRRYAECYYIICRSQLSW